MDVVHRRAPPPHRARLLSDLATWIEQAFGHRPLDVALFERALTHGSREDAPSYERLEFLGDRVLGLSVAEQLYATFPHEPEGMLSRRINILVSGATCAAVAREIGATPHLRVGKGAKATVVDSDNVLGDVLEALLGAMFLEAGFEPARAWVRRHWAGRLHAGESARKHPKAELQEWALAHQAGLPAYELLGEAGPDHQPVHTVRVRVGVREASATASTKREAEAAAARALIDAIHAEPAPARRRRPRGRTTGVAAAGSGTR